MKFTCENCGAQYLIADSKLGERGVKVRCKKCSYVIILRPPGWSPDQKKEAKEEAPQSADIDVPISAREARDSDAVAKLPSFPSPSTPSENEIAVAPDMGLSQEFAALGFQDQNDGGVLDSSPFTVRSSGGSLDHLASFDLESSSGPYASERANSDATEVVLNQRTDLGSSVPTFDDDRIGDPTHVERVEASEENTPPEQDGSSGELGEALAKVQRNELLEMRSHLESDLEGLSTALDPHLHKPKPEPRSASRVESHKPNFQALNALASESVEDPSYNIADEARAEQEIGSAFAAMFSEPATEDGFGNGAPPDKLPTRVFDTEAMEKVEAEQAMARPASMRAALPAEWYVAIDDNQVGPLTIDEVVEKWDAGELAADSLCWKQGLPDWQPIKLTAELRVRLGPMEDRERTVVAAIEDDSMPGSPVPPQISIHPDPPEQHPMAASGGVAAETAMDEPSWRPSAASALASLAAEELASASSSGGLSAKKADDVAVGAAMPATSDALEKLLAGDGNAVAATAFGAAEKSESSVRPLPRRAEAITSIPLRDPVASRSRSTLMLSLSILGASIILVGGVVWALSGKDKQVAMAPQPGEAVAMVAGANPPPAPETPPPARAPEAAKAAEAPPPAETKAAEGGATETKAVEAKKETAPAETSAKAEEKEQGDEEEGDSEDKEAKKKKKKKKSESKPEKPRRERRELAEAPPPPPPSRRASSEDAEIDDLLGPTKRPSERASFEENIPRQLDDGDILKVLRTNRKAIIDCVKKQTAADPSVSGTMMVNMVITKSGQTTRITVSPDRYTKTVAGKCVTAAVKNWKFPKFSGPNMPIDFPVRIR